MTETIPNPPDLPARFEIRRLESKHKPFICAILAHSNMFCSPVWPVLYPENKTERCLNIAKTADYLVEHQIASGMSFGVFDREYKYKSPESAKTQGALGWDLSGSTEDTDAKGQTGDDLLAQMDFPLVSVALAYDGINPLDTARIMPLIEQLPLFATMYHFCEEHDRRDPSSYKPTGPRQVLMRNATSTRQDYEGMKTMGALARHLMREAKAEGYRAINIEAAHDAVAHVWLNPPSPFKAELICALDPKTYEEEKEDGTKVKPFAASDQIIRKIWVNL